MKYVAKNIVDQWLIRLADSVLVTLEAFHNVLHWTKGVRQKEILDEEEGGFKKTGIIVIF